MMESYAYVYLGSADTDPRRDRAELVSGDFRMIVVGVSSPAQAAEVATELVNEGALAVDLCGVFSAQSVADVVVATEGRVPVGLVMYGFDSIPAVARSISESTSAVTG